MFSSASGLSLSATDLSNFLNCRHRKALELGEARGKQQRPQFNDPVLEALLARGLEHERHYVASLQRDRWDTCLEPGLSACLADREDVELR